MLPLPLGTNLTAELAIFYVCSDLWMWPILESRLTLQRGFRGLVGISRGRLKKNFVRGKGLVTLAF